MMILVLLVSLLIAASASRSIADASLPIEKATVKYDFGDHRLVALSEVTTLYFYSYITPCAIYLSILSLI